MKSADPRAKNIDKLILEMITTDNLPFSVVQNIGFQRLISKLEPRYGIKSEKFYRTELFPLMYEDVRNKIKELMSEYFAGSSISFTTDCWSGNTESMMSLTAHFINKKWKKMEIVLNIKVLESSHGDARRLADILETGVLDTKRQWYQRSEGNQSDCTPKFKLLCAQSAVGG